jgi:hypothetical protein
MKKETIAALSIVSIMTCFVVLTFIPTKVWDDISNFIRDNETFHFGAGLIFFITSFVWCVSGLDNPVSETKPWKLL